MARAQIRPKAHSPMIFADDLMSVMDSLHIDKFDILGWSDGGNTGLATAIHYPDRVNKLVIMGANVFSNSQAIEDSVLNIFKKRAEEYRCSNEQQYKITQLVLQEPHFTKKQLHSIKCPTLVMSGERDVIKENHTLYIKEQIPNSRLKIIPNADHYAPLRVPEKFNSMV